MSTPPPPPPPPPPGDMPPPPPPPPGGMPAGGGSVPVGEAIGYGWKKFTENVGPWLAIAAVVLVVGVIQVAITVVAQPDSIVVSLLLNVVFQIAGFVVLYGVVRAALGVTEGRAPSLGEAWNMDKFGPFLVAAILEGLIVGVGLLLCVIPGVLAMFFLVFTPLFVIDQDLSPVEALKASFDLVKRNAGGLLVFLLAVFGVYLLGLLACGIGVIVSAPVALTATAFVFKRLTGQPVAAA